MQLPCCYAVHALRHCLAAAQQLAAHHLLVCITCITCRLGVLQEQGSCNISIRLLKRVLFDADLDFVAHRSCEGRSCRKQTGWIDQRHNHLHSTARLLHLLIVDIMYAQDEPIAQDD